jgi:NAD(P)-dependent dehydrogenase (short-subunit alcohol dehydrogenase family)
MGRDIALKLADDGFDVAVNDIAAKDDNLDQVVAEIRAKGRSSSKHIADVSVDAQVREMVEQVVTQHGGLDVVRYSFIEKCPHLWRPLQMVSNAGVLGRPLSIVDGAFR